MTSFEATGQRANEYRVCALRALYIIHCPPTITFTTTDPANYPVPSPRYLAIHAPCARASRKVMREREFTTVLVYDGGSAALLEQLLVQSKIEDGDDPEEETIANSIQ
ncbi:uncharacterized protein BT62DRAFT_1006872 [Guyanagaster necrorhizus]|uniref:Uncharacterized protein n=1 Tax=Guyanagaster necrorhizus TaxID=856835 RepID=A0A9P7VQY4_9AGAR|nr:uncharacterized protein BT62DRAFT_1006872 [Guyanagaster necrorhizus MCA 3950]KAG7445187.1 hypothetical protein BT62DRAFT_1006872 [Guyanagaster necrorhizus MCA 3950]